MKYILELCDLNGKRIGSDADCLLVSENIIPIPHVGDDIDVVDKGILRVVNRHYAYYGDTPEESRTAHVKLFCRPLETE